MLRKMIFCLTKAINIILQTHRQKKLNYGSLKISAQKDTIDMNSNVVEKMANKKFLKFI